MHVLLLQSASSTSNYKLLSLARLREAGYIIKVKIHQQQQIVVHITGGGPEPTASGSKYLALLLTPSTLSKHREL